MATTPRVPDGVVGPAVFGSAVLSALIVTGKTARDALFCAYFPSTELPKTMVAGAALSALLALLATRAFRRQSPGSILPPLLLLNALGFIVEHAAFAASPRIVAMALYLHVSAVTGLVASGFWSIVNERFDPHALRRAVSRIGLGGTVGGFVGGLTAERLASWAGARESLLELAALSVIGAWSLRRLGAPESVAQSAPSQAAPALGSTYLREIALFVGLTALTSSVVDFAFKANAMGRYTTPETLMQFFALFYTGTSLLSFLVQGIVTPRLLSRAGLGVGLGVLPAALSLSGVLALAVPGLWTQGVLRAADGALVGSLYRSAYEPLYTPIAAERKRSLKALIDVLVNRAGDALGSLLSWGLVLLSPAAAGMGANTLVAVVALSTLLLSRRLRRGYIAELAASLRSGAVVLDEEGVEDQTTRLTLSQTLTDLNRERLLREIAALRSPTEGRPAEGRPTEAGPAASGYTPGARALGVSPPLPRSPSSVPPAMRAARSAAREAVVFDPRRGERASAAVADLTSGDPERLLRGLEAPDPELTAFVIPLLGRDDVGAQAMKALSGFGTRVVGQLADALHDTHTSPSVRRRLVRVIATTQSPWSAAALGAALEDPDFDVRRQIVRGLEDIAAHGVHLPIERQVAVAAVARELTAASEASDADRIEHALRLLGLVFDREAFRLARGALDSADPKLRGTALEYLDNVLPSALKATLFPLIPDQRAPKSERVTEELIDELRRSGLFDLSARAALRARDRS
ncbi:MAG: HEAT repeat domain-containing protein [Deltaproteobacteria bacterium]